MAYDFCIRAWTLCELRFHSAWERDVVGIQTVPERSADWRLVLAWVHADNPLSCIISAGKAPMQNSHVKEVGAAVGMGAEEEQDGGKKNNNVQASEKQAISITGGLPRQGLLADQSTTEMFLSGEPLPGNDSPRAVISRMGN